MITIEENYFNIDTTSITNNLNIKSSFIKDMKNYISTFKTFYNLHKFLQVSIYNVENFLALNGAKSSIEIDNILINLENFSEANKRLLEGKEINKWFNYPLKMMIYRTETSNMSLQGMLGTQQALAMSNEDR